MSYGDEIQILLVEDDDIDIRAIKRAFNKYGITNDVTVATDGVEALDMLRGENGHLPLPRPYLILLDLNMPRMGGLEFLETIRLEPTLRDSIVFVLTSSESDRDILSAYDQNVAGYIIKKEVGNDFMKLIQLLDEFRITIRFPPVRDKKS